MSESDDNFNPYEAPDEAADEFDEDGRMGPPWEMPGPLLRRFFATANGIVRSPSKIFAETRREGKESAARNYALLAGTVGFVGLLFNLFAIIAIFGLGDDMKGLTPEQRGREFGRMASGLACCAALPIPLMVWIGLYLYSAVVHLSLFFVGGARRRMGTTFRAYAYAMATGIFWNIIPIYGWLTILQTWYTLSVALAELHGISRWRAFFALVLFPITFLLLYIGVVLGLFLVVYLLTARR